MKKLIGAFCLVFFVANLGFAQTADSVVAVKPQIESTHGSVKYNGAVYPCQVYMYDAPPDIVETSIKDAMASKGYQASSNKGFLVYRNVDAAILDISHKHGLVDLFIQIAKASRKEKEKSEVSIIVTEPEKIGDKKADKNAAAAITTFAIGKGAQTFVSVEKHMEHGLYLKALSDQETSIIETEKEIKKLDKEFKNMQDKLEKLQKDMKDNRAALEAAQKKLADQNKSFEQLKAEKVEKPQ